LAGLGRVGQVPALPGTFPVELQVFYPGLDGRLQNLDVDALSEGAVCFVGRDENGPALRLVISEASCDGVLAAFANLDENLVAMQARPAFGHVKSSSDLRRLMTQGFDLKGVNADQWKLLASETGAPIGVPKMGLLSWNYPRIEAPLQGGNLSKAGVIFLIRDASRPDVPGLDDAIRSGLMESDKPPVTLVAAEQVPADGPPQTLGNENGDPVAA